MKHPVALITGASRGIGREIALTFARHDYDCVITCRERIDALNAVRDEITTLGVSCLTFAGDLGCFEDCQRLFSEITDRFDRLDVLVNNAGIAHIGLIQDMTADQWNHLIQTNLSSCFYCSKLAIPMMLKNKSGNILNISSVWGQVGASCEAAYSATKGGINALTKALAKELAPSGIRVNAIAPGVILTDMCAGYETAVLDGLRDETPVGRNGNPEDIAQAAIYLADAAFVTGQILGVNGGFII